MAIIEIRTGLPKGILERIGALGVLAFLGLITGAFITAHSNTYDEPAYIGAGVGTVSGASPLLDLKEHPPLLKYLIGLSIKLAVPTLKLLPRDLVSTDNYRIGYDVLYNNNVSPERILWAARVPSMLLGLFLAGLVFWWAKRWFGAAGGFLAMAALVIEPIVATNAGLATFDMGLTAFLFAAYAFLVRWCEESRPIDIVLSGLFAGAAMSSKVNGLIFFLWALVAAVYMRKISSRDVPRAPFRWWAIGLIVIPMLVVIIVYQVRYLPYFFEMLVYRLKEVFHPAAPTPNYFHGMIKPGGWWWFYAAAFAIKSTLPFLILGGLGLFIGPSRKQKVLLLIPIITYFLFCSFSSKQQGVRYLLPIIPFICVMIGGLVQAGFKNRGIIIGVLIGWASVECLTTFPHYLSYFNQTVGGARNGSQWLVDSNLDWGQDLPLLKKFLESHGRPALITACFTTASMDYYAGENHQDLLADPNTHALSYRHQNSIEAPVEYLVVSATFREGFWLSDPRLFAWLKDRTPVEILGHSIFIYDISADAESQKNIGVIYARLGKSEFAQRQFARAARINKMNL